MKRIVFIGAGSHLHSVYDSMNKSEYEIVGCLDNLLKEGVTKEGIPVLGKLDDFNVLNDLKIDGIMLTIGDLTLREQLLRKVKEKGLSMCTIIDKSALVSTSATIKEGTFIGKGAIVNAYCEVGEACIINSGSIVEHDVRLHENIHVAPGAVICGGVEVEKGTMVGANATIIQQLHIGSNVTIGAGATIIRNVDNNKVIVGTPGKEIN